MTSIRIERGQNTYELAIVGHAGYAEEGKDIVCAAISILTYMLEAAVKNNSAVYERYFDIQPGLAIAQFEFKDTEGINAVLDLTESGLKIIAENYPDYVKFEKIKIDHGSLGVNLS